MALKCCGKSSSFAMNRLLWALAAIGSIVVLLWAGIVFMIFSGQEEPREVAQTVATPNSSERLSAPAAPERSIALDAFSSSPVSQENQATQIPNPPAAADGEGGSWQQVIQGILMNDGEPAMLSGRLASALPGLPPEGQMEAAQHMVNLLGDQEYSVAATVYFNSAIPEPVRRLVFEDFMNRPNAVKLPLLVRTLRETGHPMRREAIENLQVYIGRDEGEDWVRWDAAVRETLERERREQDAAQGGGS
jgi:hypothetical protein